MSQFMRVLSAALILVFATASFAAINPQSVVAEDVATAGKLDEKLTGLGQLDLEQLINQDTVEDIFRTPAGGEKMQTASLWTCRAHTYCRNGRRMLSDRHLLVLLSVRKSHRFACSDALYS
ncbi:MAG: hypothetical protein H6624_12820 [Bdellovibrionaceae bacterium]|nr:hypothetical protein [Bdellovibrionales bacterium]MCB9085226.1 hypothetical protein [Pseudobdellovibrionaceae bacterium]